MININYDGEYNQTTICGGLCSIALYISLFCFFCYYIYIIVTYRDYNLQTSKIFYEMKDLGEINFADEIKDYSWGFRLKGQPFNVIDNEYIYISNVFEHKKSQPEAIFESIGIHDCTNSSHIAQLYTHEDVLDKFGSIFCSNNLKPHQKIQGSSQHGYPTKRVRTAIFHCSEKYLKSIGSSKKCAT